MKQPVEFLLLLLFSLAQFFAVRAQYLESPCPDVFTYQVDPATNQIFGYVEISNIQVGQTAKLHVDLSIGTQLSPVNSFKRHSFPKLGNP